jgi:hypothetical protein
MHWKSNGSYLFLRDAQSFRMMTPLRRCNVIYIGSYSFGSGRVGIVHCSQLRSALNLIINKEFKE